MKIAGRLAGLAVLGAAGVWLWLTFFPTPEKIIRKNLNHLARSASFSHNEGMLTRMAHVQTLADFFSTNIEINLNVPGRGDRQLAGRDEIIQAALAARSAVNKLTVQFPDIMVNVSPDKQSASVEVTLEAVVSGQEDPIIERMRLTFQKINDQWLITRAKNVPLPD